MDTARANELLAALRVHIDELEHLLNTQALEDQDALPTFDPDTDTPPIKPSVSGNELQTAWCGLMLWAGLRALNVRQGRAATPEESVAIAKAAGYLDGRGWNAWTHGWQKDDQGGRFIDGHGLRHLRAYLEATGRKIPSDLEWSHEEELGNSGNGPE